MQALAASPRDRLLAAAVDYVVANGISNLSLRELAAAIGTSHRMLIYHFGSKEGLLVAVIRSVEAAQREFFGQLLRAQPELSPGDGIRLIWRHFTDPQFAPHGWQRRRTGRRPSTWLRARIPRGRRARRAISGTARRRRR